MRIHLLLLICSVLGVAAQATELSAEGDRVDIAAAASNPRYGGAVGVDVDEQIGVGWTDLQARAAVIDGMNGVSDLDLSGLNAGSQAPQITSSELGQLGVMIAGNTTLSQIPIVPDLTVAKMRSRLSEEEQALIEIEDGCEISNYERARSRRGRSSTTVYFGDNAVTRVRRFTIFVHCQDRKNYRFRFVIGIDANGDTVVRQGQPRDISPNSRQAKVSGPIAVIPGGQAADLTDGTELAAYIAAPDAVPTLVVIDPGAADDDRDPPGSVVQPATSRAAFSSNIELCSSPGRAYAWLAWTNSNGQAVLSRYADGALDLMTLGASDGPVDLACTAWGEVLITWVSGNSTVNLALVDQSMQTVGQSTESINAASATRSAVAVSHSGLVALVWGPSLFSGSGAPLQLQRYRLSNFIDPADLPRGTWINVDGSGGEGWFLDLVQRGNGDIELIATFFGYESDPAMPANEAMWLIAQGVIVNGSAQMPVLRTVGGAFNSTSNPGNVMLPPWGSARADLLGCNLLRIAVVDGNGSNVGYFFLQPAEVLLAGESFCNSIDNPGGTAFETRFPLTWFNATQSGEGIFFSVLQRASGPPELLAANYTYLNDGSGTQLWLFGSAPITQNAVVDIEMFSGRGTGFGANFDTNASQLTSWGTMRVERTLCNQLVASWDESARFGAGSVTMEPVTLANLTEDPCG